MTKEEQFLIKHGGGQLKNSYKLTEIKHILSRVDLSLHAEQPKVEKLKKGDVFVAHGGAKPRPHVIAKVMTEGSYCIPLTTTNDFYASIPHNSRFLGEGYFSNQMVYLSNEYIKKHFVGVLDSSRDLNKAIKLITRRFNKQKWY